MENISKKSNFKDTSFVNDYSKGEKTNKARTMTFKSLDKLADEIRGYKRERPLDVNNVSSKQNTVSDTSKNNLSLKELGLLSGAIKGEVKINSNESVSKGRKNTLSLDRLANNIKNKI